MSIYTGREPFPGKEFRAKILVPQWISPSSTQTHPNSPNTRPPAEPALATAGDDDGPLTAFLSVRIFSSKKSELMNKHSGQLKSKTLGSVRYFHGISVAFLFQILSEMYADQNHAQCAFRKISLEFECSKTYLKDKQMFHINGSQTFGWSSIAGWSGTNLCSASWPPVFVKTWGGAKDGDFSFLAWNF